MTTRVRKWGNSLAVRIPRAYAEEAHLTAGAEVDLKVRDGAIVIVPTARPTYSLDELLKGVTRRNRHGETSTGAPVGREAW